MPIMSKKLEKTWQRIKRKLIATKSVWTSWKDPFTISVAPESTFRHEVNSILIKNIKPQSAQHLRVLESTTEEIILKTKAAPDASLEKSGLAVLDGALTEAFWLHGQLAGLTATWEFKIRLFGTKLGISPNIPIENKSRQNRSKKSVQHRSLSSTISEINRNSGNRLNLKLDELSGLRDAIIHCNPQGMRAYSQSVFGKQPLMNLRGNVMIMNLGSQDIKNMSDVEEEKDIENQELFSWFLEVFNSGLPKKAFDAFGESIKAIELLTTFSASSFNERRGLFEKLVVQGKKLSNEEKKKFDDYFSQPYLSPKQDTDSFFSQIEKCFKNLRD